MELLCGMGVCDYKQFKTLYAVAQSKNPPDPSVLDILDVANKSCCEPVEAPVDPPPEPEADGRLCAGGMEEVKAVAESRTCRGTDQFAFIPPSLGGERKLRFEESALEATGKSLPKADPACETDFLEPTNLEDTRPICPEQKTVCADQAPPASSEARCH
ncbi:uncharacterized protein LOC119098801 [Pollicipes pollicipes]|uniref:uncharacterized protein LOC119098801 n=1 Tax=Pollicipes pollicipes TaxID=41117 RepID=UPI001884FB1F|nr:uncharacterized protein LOC119098801 [Pollicipes pollicipes]